MKKGFLLLTFIIINLFPATFASHFIACESKYALCTTAACTPIAGRKDLVSCKCDVKTGYSAATKQCKPVKETHKGQLIYSRYHPVTSYAVCSNDRPWAWCLDKPCIIDKNDPTKAMCACSVVKNLGKYVIVTDIYNKSTCTTGIISSATVQQITQITNFLKTKNVIETPSIKVINKK